MLILNRRVGETVIIGNDINVTVLGVRGNHVRLGVHAPRTVPVHREEIYERIQREGASESQRVITVGTLQTADRTQDRTALHDSYDASQHAAKHRDD